MQPQIVDWTARPELDGSTSFKTWICKCGDAVIMLYSDLYVQAALSKGAFFFFALSLAYQAWFLLLFLWDCLSQTSPVCKVQPSDLCRLFGLKILNCLESWMSYNLLMMCSGSAAWQQDRELEVVMGKLINWFNRNKLIIHFFHSFHKKLNNLRIFYQIVSVSSHFKLNLFDGQWSFFPKLSTKFNLLHQHIGVSQLL